MPQAKDRARRKNPADLYKMQRLRNGSAAKRIAISLIGLYALLLQGIFAPPAPAFASLDEIICTQNGFRSEAPNGEHRHHDLCCILACAASGNVFAAVTARTFVFPVRAPARLDFANPPATATRAAAKFYLPVRGPPLAV